MYRPNINIGGTHVYTHTICRFRSIALRNPRILLADPVNVPNRRAGCLIKIVCIRNSCILWTTKLATSRPQGWSDKYIVQQGNLPLRGHRDGRTSTSSNRETCHFEATGMVGQVHRPTGKLATSRPQGWSDKYIVQQGNLPLRGHRDGRTSTSSNRETCHFEATGMVGQVHRPTGKLATSRPQGWSDKYIVQQGNLPLRGHRDGRTSTSSNRETSGQFWR